MAHSICVARQDVAYVMTKWFHTAETQDSLKAGRESKDADADKRNYARWCPDFYAVPQPTTRLLLSRSHVTAPPVNAP